MGAHLIQVVFELLLSMLRFASLGDATSFIDVIT